MKKTWRTLLTVLLLVCFVVCAVLMLRQFCDYRKGAESAKLAMELAAEPETVQSDMPSEQPTPVLPQSEEQAEPDAAPELPLQP